MKILSLPLLFELVLFYKGLLVRPSSKAMILVHVVSGSIRYDKEHELHSNMPLYWYHTVEVLTMHQLLLL